MICVKKNFQRFVELFGIPEIFNEVKSQEIYLVCTLLFHKFSSLNTAYNKFLVIFCHLLDISIDASKY